MYERIAPEQYDSLDGVPEPSEVLQLFGHDAVVAQLTAAHRAAKLPHALVFAGPRGIGKATTAFQLAHYLLSHPSPDTAPDAFCAADPVSSLYRQVAERRASLGAAPDAAAQRKDQGLQDRADRRRDQAGRPLPVAHRA